MLTNSYGLQNAQLHSQEKRVQCLEETQRDLEKRLKFFECTAHLQSLPGINFSVTTEFTQFASEKIEKVDTFIDVTIHAKLLEMFPQDQVEFVEKDLLNLSAIKEQAILDQVVQSICVRQEMQNKKMQKELQESEDYVRTLAIAEADSHKSESKNKHVLKNSAGNCYSTEVNTAQDPWQRSTSDNHLDSACMVQHRPSDCIDSSPMNFFGEVSREMQKLFQKI